MKNPLNFKAAAMCAALASVFGATATAQIASNGPITSASVKSTFDVEDVQSILAGLSISAERTPYENNESATLAATTEGGGKFLISLFGCDDPVAGKSCAGAATYTAFSNAGLAYDDINTFNKDAKVSKAINVGEQNVVIFGFQRFFAGGVSQPNFEYGTILFLQDMQDFVVSRNTASTSVSLLRTEDSVTIIRGKADNLEKSPQDFTAAGVAGVVSPAGVIGAAIANTGFVTFQTGE